MPLKSMTGFSRADGATEDVSWHWELRTVNGRGRDIRLRLPFGYEALEQTVRDICAKRITRGNCNISLNVSRTAGEGAIRLNEEVLAEVIRIARRTAEKIDAAPPSIDGLIAIKGVLERAEPEEDDERIEKRQKAIIESFTAAADRVVDARAQEGARLDVAVTDLIDRIEALVQQIEQAPERKPEWIRQQIKTNLERLLETTDRFDEQRLHQEAALIATKVDIEEEIQRLKAHIESARDLVRVDGPVGRKLDFLTQEFNREANTVCSKSNAAGITQIGLELKSAVDQMREQVQNIE